MAVRLVVGCAAVSPSPATPTTASLTSRRPDVGRDRLLAERVPPPHFAGESFDTYRPDPEYPSQAAAVTRLREVAATLTGGGGSGGLLGRLRRRPAAVPAVYLDGGFGVGKTHLLASLAAAVGPEAAAYGTFVEWTNLVGALGFRPTVDALATRKLVCIDEFELDDPGDTVLMATLLSRLAGAGVSLAATSNTLPDALGQGRFAAEANTPTSIASLQPDSLTDRTLHGAATEDSTLPGAGRPLRVPPRAIR